MKKQYYSKQHQKLLSTWGQVSENTHAKPVKQHKRRKITYLWTNQYSVLLHKDEHNRVMEK